MKIFLLAVCMLLSSVSASANWITSFEEARKLALGTNKFMIVDFWAPWCGPCKKMDKESWQTPEVQALLENYIPVKLNVDENRELADRYGIEAIPHMMILDGNGKEVYSFTGYHNLNNLKIELERFARPTDFLSAELINQFRMPGFTSQTALAQRYFDYTLTVDNNLKKHLIRTALTYLSDAEGKLLKKDADYASRSQKIKLLQLNEFAYQRNFEKLSKKLNDFKQDEIASENQQHYLFLKLLAAKAMNTAEIPALEEKLKTTNLSEAYIESMNAILNAKT